MKESGGHLSPTWSAVSHFEDEISLSIGLAESASENMTVKENEYSQEFMMAYTGASKTVAKQFKTLLTMIQLASK